MSARARWLARITLLLLAAAGLAWLARLDYARKISTNVIDLIPVDERVPELDLIRRLAGDRQSRVVLLALQAPDAPASLPAAASAFVDSLRASGCFDEITRLDDTAPRDALGRYVFDHRLELLLPSWLAHQSRAFAATGAPAADWPDWLAAETVRQLDAFLARPAAAAFSDLVPQDPLLLVPRLATAASALDSTGSDTPGTILVWARLAASPFEEAGQSPVFAAIDSALAAARAHTPAVTLRWTGVNRFAAASKARIHHEVSTLNLLSLIAVLAVAIAFVPRVWRAFHLLPVVLMALLGGWVAVTALFDRLHILVFVIGALLTGVAIDYGFYLYLQPALHPAEAYPEKFRRLLKPLLTSCLTTVIGFAFLLSSDLPLIRQLGVFVSAGLVSALAAAMLYFAQVRHPYLTARQLPRPRPTPARARAVRLLSLLALIIAVAGPWRLHWHDDIRELQVPAHNLDDNDTAVRRLFGDSSAHTLFLTRGSTPAAARTALARFESWDASINSSSSALPLKSQISNLKSPSPAPANLGLVLPLPADYAALPDRLHSLPDWPAALARALAAAGYDAASFQPFFDAWRAFVARPVLPGYDALARDFSHSLSGPLALLLQIDPDQTWFISLASHATTTAAPPADTATTEIDQLRSLNNLFARYRANALHLSLAGLAVIGLSVFVLYGLRRGLRIFMIPAGASFLVFGLLGLSGQTLNLFHLLGAFLGVCLSHNYAIFSAENAGRGEPPPVSIRLSALTTGASFGVLAFSRIPVVSALGATVALIVLTALLFVELENLARPSAAAAP